MRTSPGSSGPFSNAPVTTSRSPRAAPKGSNSPIRYKPDVVLLDVELPDISGLDVCTSLSNSSDAFILMVSGHSREQDILLGLGLGRRRLHHASRSPATSWSRASRHSCAGARRSRRRKKAATCCARQRAARSRFPHPAEQQHQRHADRARISSAVVLRRGRRAAADARADSRARLERHLGRSDARRRRARRGVAQEAARS